jgi:hypothetical protein
MMGRSMQCFGHVKEWIQITEYAEELWNYERKAKEPEDGL